MSVLFFLSFFFNDTATTEIYTLSLHDALPIWQGRRLGRGLRRCRRFQRLRQPRRRQVHAGYDLPGRRLDPADHDRSEEHTSELQSRRDLVCRLLLEKKKKKNKKKKINKKILK